MSLTAADSPYTDWIN